MANPELGSAAGSAGGSHKHAQRLVSGARVFHDKWRYVRSRMLGARHRRGSPLVWVTVVLVLLLGTVPAYAVFDFVEPRWDSTTALLRVARDQLGKQRVVLGAQLDWEQLTPADGVLVLHPQTRIEFAEASAFMGAGGRFAVVDDFGQADQLLRRFHVTRIAAPSKPLQSHLGNPELQIARPATAVAPGGYTKHPIALDVERVITNHPTALQTQNGIELTPVLELPDEAGEAYLFALIGVIGDAGACGLTEGNSPVAERRCGRLFAMGDPSVFIDLMMQFEGNQKLAQGLIQYLVEDDVWGKRGGRLYIVANDFQQTGHYGGETDLRRSIESTIGAVEQWLSELQKRGLPGRLAITLAAAAAMGIAAWAWRSTGKLYERPVPRYARPPSLVRQGGAAGRAAVLSAPTTRGVLILLELKSALQEQLRDALRLPSSASDPEILSQLERRGILDAPRLRQLSEQLAEMHKAELAIAGDQPLQIGTEVIENMTRTIADILLQVRRAAGQAPRYPGTAVQELPQRGPSRS